MERVISFATMEDAKKFTAENPGYKLTVVYVRDMNGKTPTEKKYVAYDPKKCPPINNALLEQWENEGLI